MGKAKLQLVTILGLSLVALLLLSTVVVQDADASMHLDYMGPNDMAVKRNKDLVRPSPGPDEVADDTSTPAGATP
jgi:hypothetical protein